jgi:hypothetical protein
MQTRLEFKLIMLHTRYHRVSHLLIVLARIELQGIPTCLKLLTSWGRWGAFDQRFLVDLIIHFG